MESTSAPIQNQPQPVQNAATVMYAGFWLRFVAYIIDGIILAIFYSIVGGFHGAPQPGYYGHHMHGFSNDSGISSLYIPIAWLYFSLMESSVWQATLGKRLMNIKVTDLNGMRIGFGRATGRYFAKFISAIIICIGFIMVAFTQKKQGLHDMIAKTLVVKTK